MKISTVLLTGMIVIGWSQPILAQGSLASNANMAVQITEARKANALLMHQYTWNSRTELLEGGEIKDNRIELVNYGPGGQLQRSLLNDSGSSLPRGFLRRAIAEQKKKEMEQYLTGLRTLLDQYTLPTAGKVLDFMSQAVTTGPDANGIVTMTGTNVVMPGDSFTIWSLAATKRPTRVQANTFYEGNMVELTATFHTLASGLNYVAYAEVTIPAKQMSIQVQNFNYQRSN